MKKSLSLILLCLLFCAAITMSCAHAEELGVVTNPHWKPGSSATATWDAVDGANYYCIVTSVYYDGQKLGETETGTSDTELDVQQEIHEVVGEAAYDVVEVSFTVTPAVIGEDGSITTGSISSESPMQSYLLAGPALGKPTNLVLDSNCVLSWDDMEYVISRYFYQLNLYRDGKYLGNTFGSIYSWNTDSGRCSYNFASQVDKIIIALGLTGQDITINAILKPYGSVECNGSTYALEGEMSDYSNSMLYRFDADVPVLGKPTGLVLDSNCILSWGDMEYAISRYFYQLNFYRDGKYLGNTFGSIYNWNTDNGRCSYDFASQVDKKIIALGLIGQDISINAILKPYGSVEYNGSTYALEGEMSDYSNSIVYNTNKKPDKITLSPASPALYLGNSLYLGKTIEPEDAYYEHIDWSSSDEGIVPVSTMGRITGAAVGSATVTAAIGDVTDSVEVTVYDISSNIEDPDEQNHVTDTAGDIIDDIVNSDDPDVDNTDIDAGDLTDIREDIQEGLWRGDAFFTDVVWYEENFGKYKDNWGQIQKAAKELNAQFAGAYNIEVEMHHKDSEGTDYHIGNITELENEITFTFDLPTGKHEIQSGNARKYVLVRIHKNSIEAIDASIGEDGTVTAKSDRFSDFVLVYVDEPAAAIDLSGYAKLVLPQGTTDIEASAFEGICAEVVVVPESCSHIGERAFADCPSLKYIVLAPGSEAEIDPGALAGSDAEIIYQSITAG